MKRKPGFIGMGNMGQALCAGFLKAGKIAAADVRAYTPHYDRLEKLAGQYGFTPCRTLSELIGASDILIMACKPYQIEEVLGEAGDAIRGAAILSIAAGWDFAKYQDCLGDTARVQAIMPNTPAMVGEGVILFEERHSLLPEEREWAMDLFGAVGLVQELPSRLFGIGGTVTGCGPAFVDLFMEGYADVAVKYGLPRPTAYRLIAQTVLGAAKLQLETGEHPGVLKDQVCSPAGTTIRGVAALEEAGFRGACIRSVEAIMENNRQK